MHFVKTKKVNLLFENTDFKAAQYKYLLIIIISYNLMSYIHMKN